MKNVLVYNIVDNKERYNTELLFNYFRAQIDNSLNYGWDKKDIILATNFDFNYKDIESVRLNNICEYNIFNNKYLPSPEKAVHAANKQVTSTSVEMYFICLEVVIKLSKAKKLCVT